MIRKFKTGQRVWWNDPAGETSCEYEVLDPREDYNADRAEDGTSDDRVILVGDEHGEAEVYTCELEMLCPLTRSSSGWNGRSDVTGLWAKPCSAV